MKENFQYWKPRVRRRTSVGFDEVADLNGDTIYLTVYENVGKHDFLPNFSARSLKEFYCADFSSVGFHNGHIPKMRTEKAMNLFGDGEIFFRIKLSRFLESLVKNNSSFLEFREDSEERLRTHDSSILSLKDFYYQLG